LTGQSRHAFFPVIAQLPPASALSAAIGGQVAGQSRKKEICQLAEELDPRISPQ